MEYNLAMDKSSKKAANSAEDITSWLATETGHTETPDEGYGPEKGMDLPKKRKQELSQFFDGLEVEKAMTAQRREDAVAEVDDAAELRKAIAPRLTEGTPGATAY